MDTTLGFLSAAADGWRRLGEEHLPFTDPVLIFALVMVLILLAPMLARRLRMPDIIGLIFAGILIGPNAIGLLDRDQTMILLGTVGLLYIMFMAGLEVDLNEFFKYRNRSLIFGALTFALPQGLGTMVALTLLGMSWPAAILLASMFASHTLVAYPTVIRLGIARNSAVTTAIGGTIITDTAALLVLAVIAASETGELTVSFWLRLAGALGVYVFAVLWGLSRLGRWFFRHAADGGAIEYVFVIAAGFACAYLAQVAGVEPIIGAFLAGLALNRLIPHQGPLMNRIHFVGNALFVPFFLVSVGMLVDLRLLWGSSTIWLVGVSMVVTVTVTKWLAARAAQRLLHYSSAEGMVIFGLSVPQAAATLAAVFVGFKIGLFGDEILNGTVMMILVTCILGPWAVERFGRIVAMDEERSPYRPGDAPQRLLVPLGNPVTANTLMDLAFALREPDSHEPLYPMTVARDDGHVEAHVAAGEKMLGHAVIHAAGAGVPVIPVTRVDINVANGITRAMTEMRISDLLIGWHGRPNLRQQVFGTILDQVLARTQQTVMICRLDQPLNTTQRVVVIVPPLIDRQPGFIAAVRSLKLLAHHIGATLHVVAAEPTLEQVRDRFAKGRPDVDVSLTALSTWAAAAFSLREIGQEHDMLVLFSARKGRLAWQPMLDRLPSLLAQQHVRQNLMVIYPSEIAAEPASRLSEYLTQRTLTEALAQGRTAFDLDDMSHEEALRRIVALAFADDPPLRQAMTDVLIRNSAGFPAEVTPGVVLVHAHVSAVDEPMVLLGISQSGLQFPLTERPAHLVFVLLSPGDRSPEQHLQALAAIARLVRDPATVEHLRAARSPQQLRQTLETDQTGESAAT